MRSARNGSADWAVNANSPRIKARQRGASFMVFSNLNITDFYRFIQRRDFVPDRNEFLSHVSLVSGFHDRPHDGRITDLLRIVDLVAARISGRVIVADP